LKFLSFLADWRVFGKFFEENIGKAMENIQYPWKTFNIHKKHSINYEKHSISMENIQKTMENIQKPWKTFNIHGKHSISMENIQYT
jgi:hypothetical protein